MKSTFFKIGLLSAMVSVLVACGGGGGGGSNASSTPTPPSSLSGIAAIGAAMAGAKVTLKDSNGKTATASADSNGNFSFSNIGGFTPPIMLRAEAVVDGTSYKLHSLLISAPTTGDTTLNVTPATEALTAQTLGGTPTLAFDSSGSGFKEAKSAKLAAAKAKLMAALEDTLLALGLDTEVVDLMTSKFAANNEGFDKLLDLVEFSANTQGAITLKEKNSNNNTPLTINRDDSSDKVSKISVSVGGDTTLNTTGIDDLIKRLIADIEGGTPLTSSDYDENFLFQGSTKEDFTTQSTPNTTSGSNNFTIDSKYKIKKCDQAAKVCYVGLQIKTNSSEIALMNIDMGVKQDNSGSWKLYGDQAPFVYRSTPMFIYGESASGTGPLKNGYLKNAVAITFPGTACNGCTDKVYESATIKISYDKGLSYSDSLTIGAGELSLFENNSSYREDLLPAFSNETAKKLNDANQTGKLKIRITAYSKTLGQKTWEPPIFPLLFSSETEVKEFMKEKNWGIGQGLTTRSVTFTGDGILSVFAALKHPSYQDVLTIPYLASKFTEKQITPLKNDDSCSMVVSSFSQNQMDCDVFFNNSIIMTAGLISSDAKGRGIFYLKVP
jgi:hypothetical protein